MPKPIPAEMLKNYERAFHEFRERWREMGDGLGMGPCVINGDSYCPESTIKSLADDEHPELIPWRPIPEIQEIIKYLEELPETLVSWNKRFEQLLEDTQDGCHNPEGEIEYWLAHNPKPQ